MTALELAVETITHGHKKDIHVSPTHKLCYNPMKDCWMWFGKKKIFGELNAIRHAQHLKELLE